MENQKTQGVGHCPFDKAAGRNHTQSDPTYGWRGGGVGKGGTNRGRVQARTVEPLGKRVSQHTYRCPPPPPLVRRAVVVAVAALGGRTSSAGGSGGSCVVGPVLCEEGPAIAEQNAANPMAGRAAFWAEAAHDRVDLTYAAVRRNTALEKQQTHERSRGEEPISSNAPSGAGLPKTTQVSTTLPHTTGA